MKGRKPTPTYLKLLRGNPGRRPISEDEPTPMASVEAPSPPPFLDGHAADEWWRVAPELHRIRLLTIIDESVLASYCISYARWRNAEEMLAQIRMNDPRMRGLLAKGTLGHPIEHPLIAVSRRAAQEMLRVACEFGFTPAARARIAAGLGGKASVDSKFGDLLAGRES